MAYPSIIGFYKTFNQELYSMNKEKRLEIFRSIQKLGSIWGKADCVEMLESIWNLHLFTSEDPRFKDAYGDAVQHLRNNDDWDEEYTFLTRFGLLTANDEVFHKFLNAVVSKNARSSKEEIERYVDTLNPLLRKEGIEYRLQDKREELPIYEIEELKDNVEERPRDIAKNRISFYVNKTPSSFPAFVLYSDLWDDYSRKTRFRLYYMQNVNVQGVEIGSVKIMHANEFVTKNVIPQSFFELSEEFCSVGQEVEYYKNIKEQFPENYKVILYALRDAAYFSIIADRYQYTISFQKSLLRYPDALKAFRDAHGIMEGIDMSNRYNFTLYAKRPYFDNVVNVDMSFGDLDGKDNLNRIKALIGENGSGKSSVLYSLAKALHDRDETVFENGKIPDFSKVIAISYSIFDKLFELTHKSSFNFVYCGLRNRDNELITEEDKKERFEISLEEIIYKERTYDYHCTLTEVVDEGLLNEVFQSKGNINKKKFHGIISKMSSGQAMITSIITELYAHIRENSLILFDEPEVHLHANAVTELVRILFEICNEFNSACVVATHSAVVLQELLARNVIVLEQDKVTKERRTRLMNTETLGENLTTITEDVFGRSTIDKHYGYVIRQLVRKGKSMDDIEKILKSEELPMSLNLYMYIRRQMEIKADD